MTADPGRWWQPRPALRRFVADLVEDELVRQRRSAVARPRPWPEDLAFQQDLGVDSLELMALARSVPVRVRPVNVGESAMPRPSAVLAAATFAASAKMV